MTLKSHRFERKRHAANRLFSALTSNVLCSRTAFIAVILAALVATAFASPIRVTTTRVQAICGVVTNVYFQNANGPGSSTPSPNTATSSPSTSGSYSISKGAYGYLWSPQFKTSTVIGAGNWTLYIWIVANKGKAMSISIYTTDSAGNTVDTVTSNFPTPVIGTTEITLALTMQASQVTVPANGYIEIALYASSAAYTVYWGNGQLTDFQPPCLALS